MRPHVTFTVGGQPKTRKNDNTTDTKEVDWEQIGVKAAVIQQSSETAVKVLLGAYAAKKLIDTACEIAVIAAKRRL